MSGRWCRRIRGTSNSPRRAGNGCCRSRPAAAGRSRETSQIACCQTWRTRRDAAGMRAARGSRRVPAGCCRHQQSRLGADPIALRHAADLADPCGRSSRPGSIAARGCPAASPPTAASPRARYSQARSVSPRGQPWTRTPYDVCGQSPKTARIPRIWGR